MAAVLSAQGHWSLREPLKLELVLEHLCIVVAVGGAVGVEHLDDVPSDIHVVPFILWNACRGGDNGRTHECQEHVPATVAVLVVSTSKQPHVLVKDGLILLEEIIPPGSERISSADQQQKKTNQQPQQTNKKKTATRRNNKNNKNNTNR